MGMYMMTTMSWIFQLFIAVVGYAVAQLDEALCYEPEGQGFDSQ